MNNIKLIKRLNDVIIIIIKKISVVGIGKLGLCFALHLETKGYFVTGIDIDDIYVNQLNNKTFKSSEAHLEEYLKNSKNFKASTNLKDIEKNDFVFVLVQTPISNENHTYYDHSILGKIIYEIDQIGNFDIIVNSTVMPGFHNTHHKRIKGSLSYNPAFVSQGNVLLEYENGGKFGVSVLGTYSDKVKKELRKIYSNLHIMTPSSAEIFKIVNNSFRVMKIVYTNLVRDMTMHLENADYIEISETMKKDKSIGEACMTPGFGYGGPCYPRDVKALIAFCKSIDIDPFILDGIERTNHQHHHTLLKEYTEDSYTFTNVCYRPDMSIPMIDNSPKLKLAQDLARQNKRIIIKDRKEVIVLVKSTFGYLFIYYETCP